MDFPSIRKTLSHAADDLGLQVLETEEYEKLVRHALDESGKWHQRECPLKAPLMMWFVFALMLYRSLSIANVLKMLLHQYRLEFPSLSLKAITPEATIHARARLGVEPMRFFFEAHAAEITPKALFHGHRIFGVDGTSFNVPDTPENETLFGRPKASRGETAYPQMEAVSLVETSTRQIRDVDFTRCDSSERLGVLKVLDRLIRNDLLLMDRGISAAWLFAECLKRGIRILGRISSSWKPHVIKRLGPGDFLVTVSGEIPKELRKDKTATVKLALRMIEYKIGNNKTVRLLTDLLDPNEYPAIELARLYHARWECELSYDEIKNHLASVASSAQGLVFRSKTPEGILQEAYALFALYNMIRRLMVEAGECHDVNPLEISFVETVQIIKDTTPRLQAATTEQLCSDIYLQMLKDIAESRNLRPRRPRQNPRVVRRKMSKFKLKRKGCYQKFLDIERDMRLVG